MSIKKAVDISTIICRKGTNQEKSVKLLPLLTEVLSKKETNVQDYDLMIKVLAFILFLNIPPKCFTLMMNEIMDFMSQMYGVLK